LSLVLYEMFLDARRIAADFPYTNRNTALKYRPVWREDKCIQLLLARDDTIFEKLDREGVFGKRIGASKLSRGSMGLRRRADCREE